MRIALAQVNPTVGDVEGNSRLIRDSISAALQQKAELVIFPELITIGYPPRDLLLRHDLIEANLQAVQHLAGDCQRISAVIGCVTPNDSGHGLSLFNTAALCTGGRIAGLHHKCLLPNYDVFDERRYFESSPSAKVCEWQSSAGHKLKLGLTVCEDLWNDTQFVDQRLYQANPIAELARQGADWLINISASPYWRGKQSQRLKIFSQQAREQNRPIIYVNQVGGNDDLLFDGASMVIDSSGDLIAQARAFQEELLIVDLCRPQTNIIHPYPEDIDAVLEALILGTRDYVRKCGFKEVVIGLSGGIDSAVTAVIAARALGPKNVHGVAMPSQFSSGHSLEDAQQTADRLGIDYRVIPIHQMHEVVLATLQPHFAGRSPDTTEENLQARIRGQILMALSNKFGWLVLTTGNKSELAVGYCTLYGDMCGGLAVISDVAKTCIYQLAKRINEPAGYDLIPQRTLDKPPSAELRPDQTDQDTLPPYDLLDGILQRYVEQQLSAEEIIAAGFDPQIVREVIRRVDLNEYKRRQAAPGLKVTARAFGIGWRMPIAAKFAHQHHHKSD